MYGDGLNFIYSFDKENLYIEYIVNILNIYEY